LTSGGGSEREGEDAVASVVGLLTGRAAPWCLSMR